MNLPRCLEEWLHCYTAGNPLYLRNSITCKEEVYKICHLKTLPCLMHLVPMICFPLLCCLQSSWCRAVELAIEDERLVVFQSSLCFFTPNWSCQCRCFLFPLLLEVWSPFSKDFLNSKEDFFCFWSQKTWSVFALLFGLKTPQATPVPSKECWKPLTPRQPMSHLKSSWWRLKKFILSWSFLSVAWE